MKDFFKIFSLLFISVLTTLMFAQCSDEKDQNEPDVEIDNTNRDDFIGAWSLSDEYPHYFIFWEYGVGAQISFDEESRRYVKENFGWTYKDHKLFIETVDDSFTFTVLRINTYSLLLSDIENEEYVLRRIDESDLPDIEDNGNDNNGDDEPGGNNGDNTGSNVISTLDADPHAFRATLSGQYSGTKFPESLGIEYSYYNTFPNKKTKQVSINGKFGRFEIEAKGIVDQIKVYYRAFAYIDGVCVYGDTKSFETKPGTYSIDGVTYNFIKVTGLPTGSFSMMQTELPPDAELEIDGITVGELYINNNTWVEAGETRDFMNNFAKAAVVPRYPTAQEWMFAASGGRMSNGYTYSGSNDINNVAWYTSNSNGHVRRPALLAPNELGFYDMSGNYAELCSNYDADELDEIREKYICQFINSLMDVSAAYFDTSWRAKGGAFGGCWDSEPYQCKSNSSETYDTPAKTNSYRGNKYTVRFVYSRPD